ncbi:VOC family protein [Gloeobacter violaceus]|nr:VOC family protein [Gloeobacter violaceus]
MSSVTPLRTRLTRLGHVAVCVQDVPRAVTFYRTLGMEVAWQDEDWAFVKAGGDGLALLGPKYSAAGPHFGFVLEDEAALAHYYAQLQEQGATATTIHAHRDGTSSFYAKDLDGNTFEFLAPRTPEAARLLGCG